jgi:glutathione S-transferase
MLELYYAPHTCSLVTHIALEEAGADFKLHRVDFGKDEQRGRHYLGINPKARVPALVTDEGTLTETPAMVIFVAQTYPDAELAPLNDPYQLARVQAVNSFLSSSLQVAHAHRMRGYRWTDEESAIEAMQRFVPRSVTECYEYIEGHIVEEPWVMGSTYTVADPYLFTIAQWLEDDGVDPNRFPKVIEHRNRMLERPAVARAIEAEVGSDSAAT